MIRCEKAMKRALNQAVSVCVVISAVCFVVIVAFGQSL